MVVFKTVAAPACWLAVSGCCLRPALRDERMQFLLFGDTGAGGIEPAYSRGLLAPAARLLHTRSFA